MVYVNSICLKNERSVLETSGSKVHLQYFCKNKITNDSFLVIKSCIIEYCISLRQLFLGFIISNKLIQPKNKKLFSNKQVFERFLWNFSDYMEGIGPFRCCPIRYNRRIMYGSGWHLFYVSLRRSGQGNIPLEMKAYNRTAQSERRTKF